MATANNNKEFSGLLTPAGGTLNEIADSTDNVHTGIVKALSKLASGNIPVKGFNITGTSSNQITFATGDTLVDGVKQTVSNDLTVTIDTGNTSRYTLIVANGTSLAARTHTTDNAIPPANEDDVIIGVAKNTGSDPPLFQYLTVSKDSNSVSIARDNTGYFEEGTIKANTSSGGIDIITTQTDKDIRITPNGNGKIVLDGLNWPIADGGANQVLKTDGGGQLSFVAQPAAYTDSDAVSAVEGVTGTLALTGDVTIASGKDLTVDGTTLHVDAANDRVGVGTTSPGTPLHIVSSIATDMLRLESTDAGGTGAPDIDLFRNSASPANDDELGMIVFRGKDDAGNKTSYAWMLAEIANVANGAEQARINFHVQDGAGTGLEQLRIHATGIRIAGEAEINGNLNHDGSNVGFYGTSPASRQSVGNMGSTSVTNVAAGAFIDPGATQLFSPNQQPYLLGLENEIANLRTKVDALIDALQLYGLIT